MIWPPLSGIDADMDSEMTHLARLALVAFLFTFIFARTSVYFMSKGTVRNLFFHLRGTHIHHLNFGIFLLAGVAAYLLFWRPGSPGVDIAALVYGSGMALTFDEFGMWLHLQDNYWQRASWDAIGVIAALLALIAFAPSVYDFRLHHWLIAGALAAAVTYFALFL
ncbi:MAG: hypothetical protein IBX61_07935, partial [Thermoleophilia bacterium]|nr:hypothetical protein [Thermoleophilia bacterium]